MFYLHGAGVTKVPCQSGRRLRRDGDLICTFQNSQATCAVHFSQASNVTDLTVLLSSLWQWREWIHVVYVDDSRTIWQNYRLFLFHFPCSFKSLRVTCSFCNVIKKTESRWKHDQRFYHYVHPINYVSRAINQVCVEVSAWACKCVWESVMCVLGVKE